MDKESYRLVRSYQNANEYSLKVPDSAIVSIADREGDLFPDFILNSSISRK